MASWNRRALAILITASMAAGCGRIGYDGQLESGEADDDGGANADGESCTGLSASAGTGEIFVEEVGDRLTRLVASSCSPGSPEFAILLEADLTGTYRVVPVSEAGEAFVAVLDGENCSEPELICERQSASIELVAGQTVILAVEAPGALADDNVSLLIRSVQ